MEVKKLVELLDDFESGDRNLEIVLQSDESGVVQTWGGKRLLNFDDIADLVRYLREEKQKLLDYKSLFSVVDGRLVADFSGIEITKENCLPLSWTKWVVRGEAMNEMRTIIRAEEEKTCACCVLYLSGGGFGCPGCPIGKVTPTRNCWRTPVGEFTKAAEEGDLFAAMKANQKEADFLKSLMEQK